MELLKTGGCLRADDSARDAPGLYVSASTDVRCSGALSCRERLAWRLIKALGTR